MVRLTYQHVYDLVTNKGCSLITTIQQFNQDKMNSKSFYDIIGICGHPSRIKYDMFKAQNCGIQCKECTKSKIVNKLCGRGGTCQDIEFKGYQLIKEMLSPYFYVEKMVEGTKADFIIKPLSIQEDQWLPIQLKTTQSAKAQYSNNIIFAIGGDYTNILITFVCINPVRILAIPGDKLVGLTKLKIGTKTKYQEYIVQNVEKCYLDYYYSQPLQTFNEANTPQNKCQRREQEYRKIRENYMPYIHFEYPEREGFAYDFTVNGFKIQEKVASKRNIKNKCKETLLHTYAIHIARRVGRIKEKPYHEGENDFYWFNIPDSTLFVFIPESIMIKYKILKTYDGTSKGKTSIVIYTRQALSKSNIYTWIHKYLFDYINIPKDVVLDIFNTGVMDEEKIARYTVIV